MDWCTVAAIKSSLLAHGGSQGPVAVLPLAASSRGLKLRTCEPGAIVVTEGEIGHSLFTITSGHVKVFIANPDGRNFEVRKMSDATSQPA